MSFLSRILVNVRSEVQRKKQVRPIESIELPTKKRHGLIEAIERASKVPLIAEIKRASPSAGDLRPDADPLELAQEMLEGGAIALSVLTEPKYFKGDPSFLRELRRAVEVPLLRKDFIVDEYQLYETAELGANAVLLIAKILRTELTKFLCTSQELGLEALVEVTSEEEVKSAVSAGAELIGINNRDLETFEIDLARTEKLAPFVPEPVTLISESGINTDADVRRMLDAGADAVLVGTALMRARSLKQKVRELVEALECG
jgi:indole-3-glycerol phosphate synthase